MATRRSYHDNCGMAHALDLIGERWSLLVVRELMFGPKRFSDLRNDLPGISTNVLTDRLAELEHNGVLRRAELPPPAAAKVYELTPWGAELEDVIKVVGRWGASSPQMPTDHHVSAATIVMSLRTNFDASSAAGEDLHLTLQLGAETFTVDVADAALSAGRGSSRPADVVLVTEPAVLAGLLYGGLDAQTAVDDGVLEVRPGGADLAPSLDTVRRFVSVFRLPEPAVV